MLSRTTAAVKARVAILAGPGGACQAIAHRRAPRQGAAPFSPAPTLRTQPTAKRQRTQSEARPAREPPSLWVRTVGRRGGDHGAPAPPPRPRPRRPWPLWPWGRRAATRSLPPGRLAGSPLPLVLNERTADRRCSYRWFLPFWSRRHGVCSFRDGLYSRSWAAAATVTALVFRE